MSLVAARQEEAARLFDQMGIMLDTGLSIREALRSLAEQTSGGARRALRAVDAELDAGRSVGEAFAAQAGPGKWFRTTEARIIAAGDAGGSLPANLKRLSRDLERRARARNDLAGSLLYPVVLAHAAVLFPAVPTLVMGEGLDAFLWQVGLWFGILYGLTLGGWALVRVLRRTPPSARVVDGFALRIPALGSYFRARSARDWVATLQALYAAGIPIVEALRLASDASGNTVLRDRFEAIARDVESGRTLTEALEERAGNLLPEMLLGMVRTGERSGKLEETLERTAGTLDERASRRLDRVVLLTAAGIYALAMALAIWQIASFWGSFYDRLDAL